MRITNEADYALRIAQYLGSGVKKATAKQIAENTGVTLRFALKILRKLNLADVVGSQQGASGGYFLRRQPQDISVGEIVEIVDGPIKINNCLYDDYACTCTSGASNECRFHNFFKEINEDLRNRLYNAKLTGFLPPQQEGAAHTHT